MRQYRRQNVITFFIFIFFLGSYLI
jgi:hypothetical protein